MNEKSDEDARRVYAMVTNIDDNLNQLFQKLEVLGIEENTIVIFMTDNGPQQARFVGGMRGRKSSVYRGGIRVFFISYPSKYSGNRENESDGRSHRPVTHTISTMRGSTS